MSPQQSDAGIAQHAAEVMHFDLSRHLDFIANLQIWLAGAEDGDSSGSVLYIKLGPRKDHRAANGSMPPLGTNHAQAADAFDVNRRFRIRLSSATGSLIPGRSSTWVFGTYADLHYRIVNGIRQI